MNTTRITHVSVSKLWGDKTISADFNNDINIFIGTNGSYKTTFLNLIEAVLLVDVKILLNIDFEKITIYISMDEMPTIIVSKTVIDDSPVISYQFGDNQEIHIYTNEMPNRYYRLPIRDRESRNIIKEKITSLINISWLSINRDNSNLAEYERRDFIERIRNMVDVKLHDLTKALIFYQLQLESEANKISDKFKEEVLSLMLYNNQIDVYNKESLAQFCSIDADSIRSDLFKAFNALGVAKDKKNDINQHIDKLKGVINKLPEKIEFNDIFILSLINRTLSMIQISQEHQQQKKEIFSPIENFWKSLKKFIPNKEFAFNKQQNGNLEIKLLDRQNTKKDEAISITSLSSGEKQLFILFTEALLQKHIPYLFIADEPELSLHIDWQKKILPELLKINPQAQIIVATHSPEIAGSFPDKVINMHNIIRNE